MFLKPKSYSTPVNRPLYQSLHHQKNWVPSLLPSSLFQKPIHSTTLPCPLYLDPVKTHYPTVMLLRDLTAWKPLSSGCFRCDSHLTHQIICLQSETGNAALGLIRGQKFKHTGTWMSTSLSVLECVHVYVLSVHVCVYMYTCVYRYRWIYVYVI